MAIFIRRIQSGIYTRPYFFVALLAGIFIYFSLDTLTTWHWSTRLLISWNISAIFYLLHSMWLIFTTDLDHMLMQQQAKKFDESKWVIMLLVLLALGMCVIAIIVQLSILSKNSPYEIEHVALAMLTIVSAWIFMHTIFAFHYAHDFYIARTQTDNGGLDFPKTPDPTYTDFLYFSYIIGTSAQTADVSITSRSMRLLNIFHAFLAFCFNTTILAICINVAASFLSN